MIRRCLTETYIDAGFEVFI